jgi:hypothetical protein
MKIIRIIHLILLLITYVAFGQEVKLPVSESKGIASCSSPHGPILEIASPPPNHAWLVANGYCTYSYSTTSSFTACYTFVSPGTAVSINAGYSASCATVTFSGFTLYNSSCVSIGTGLNFTGLTPGATYTWCLTMRANGGPGCNGFDTFCPYFQNTTPLAVILNNFKIECNQTYLSFEWETDWEYQCNYFIIEHSLDAVNYKPLKSITCRGAGKYIINLKQINSGYYRLCEIDYNGQIICQTPLFLKCIGNPFIFVGYYDILGRDLGTDFNDVPKGIYYEKITNGYNVKIIKKIK